MIKLQSPTSIYLKPKVPKERFKNDKKKERKHKKRSKAGPRVLNVCEVVSAISEITLQIILFIRAWSGCDTTSATFGQGKGAILKNILASKELQDMSLLFYQNEASHVEISQAGLRIFDGQTDLASFVLSRSSKNISELIENTWKMEQAGSELEREACSRIDLLDKARKCDCIEGCNGIWLTCALEVLQNNKINAYVYATAFRDSIIKGRGKFRNIMIIGPANCGKTSLLKPLDTIYRVFSNPANDKYGWVGADKGEVILLQDFRWSRDNISWKDLLLLLEGEIVKLPAPKNQFLSLGLS